MIQDVIISILLPKGKAFSLLILPVIISRDTVTSVTLIEKEPLFIAGVNTTKTSEIRNKLQEKNKDAEPVN
ncbi:MAG TPA: hypothetical protein PKH23_01635, partial [Bacillota bacterium]|nr:hypothetical protein [Bacillota bacterium]